MIIIGEKINGIIPSVKKAIKERMELIDKEQQRRKQSDMENKLGLAALQRAFWYLKNDKSL